MPLELSRLIQDFARPMTRPGWKNGGSFPSELFWQGIREKYFGRLIEMASTAQTTEEYLFMLEDSSVPEWF